MSKIGSIKPPSFPDFSSSGDDYIEFFWDNDFSNSIKHLKSYKYNDRIKKKLEDFGLNSDVRKTELLEEIQEIVDSKRRHFSQANLLPSLVGLAQILAENPSLIDETKLTGALFMRPHGNDLVGVNYRSSSSDGVIFSPFLAAAMIQALLTSKAILSEKSSAELTEFIEKLFSETLIKFSNSFTEDRLLAKFKPRQFLEEFFLKAAQYESKASVKKEITSFLQKLSSEDSLEEFLVLMQNDMKVDNRSGLLDYSPDQTFFAKEGIKREASIATVERHIRDKLSFDAPAYLAQNFNRSGKNIVLNVFDESFFLEFPRDSLRVLTEQVKILVRDSGINKLVMPRDFFRKLIILTDLGVTQWSYEKLIEDFFKEGQRKEFADFLKDFSDSMPVDSVFDRSNNIIEILNNIKLLQIRGKLDISLLENTSFTEPRGSLESLDALKQANHKILCLCHFMDDFCLIKDDSFQVWNSQVSYKQNKDPKDELLKRNFDMPTLFFAAAIENMKQRAKTLDQQFPEPQSAAMLRDESLEMTMDLSNPDLKQDIYYSEIFKPDLLFFSLGETDSNGGFDNDDDDKDPIFDPDPSNSGVYEEEHDYAS